MHDLKDEAWHLPPSTFILTLQCLDHITLALAKLAFLFKKKMLLVLTQAPAGTKQNE
jgi:hypothetical protein